MVLFLTVLNAIHVSVLREECLCNIPLLIFPLGNIDSPALSLYNSNHRQLVDSC